MHIHLHSLKITCRIYNIIVFVVLIRCARISHHQHCVRVQTIIGRAMCMQNPETRIVTHSSIAGTITLLTAALLDAFASAISLTTSMKR